MNDSRIGPFLTLIGIFGGGLLWLLACSYRYHYLTEPYTGAPEFSGESIWALDPVFTVLATLPGLILFFIGLIIAVSPLAHSQDENDHTRSIHITPRKRVQLNLFYIGETFILVTTIIGLIAFFGVFTSAVEIMVIPTTIFAFIVIICILNFLTSLFYVLEGEADSANVTWIIRNTVLFLGIGLASLTFFVIALQLYTWSFIRTTTILLVLSGCFGMFLLFPRMNLEKNEIGAEGEI